MNLITTRATSVAGIQLYASERVKRHRLLIAFQLYTKTCPKLPDVITIPSPFKTHWNTSWRRVEWD